MADHLFMLVIKIAGYLSVLIIKIDSDLQFYIKTLQFQLIVKLNNSLYIFNEILSYSLLTNSICVAVYGGQPIKLNNVDYKFRSENDYYASVQKNSNEVHQLYYFTPSGSGVTTSNNNYIDELSNQARKWQPNKNDPNWNIYTNTGKNGDEADIYPASFIAIFGLYLFLPLLVDFSIVENTFAEDTSEIFSEIVNMYRV